MMRAYLTTIMLAGGLVMAAGCSEADTDVAATYMEVCTASSGGDSALEASCAIIPATIEKFITDPNEQRGAYALITARTFYSAGPEAREASWRIFIDRYGVDESYFDPETHRIVGGQFNELLEAMYQGAGIDYGGDRKAFRDTVEAKLNSEEARAFIEEQSKAMM